MLEPTARITGERRRNAIGQIERDILRWEGGLVARIQHPSIMDTLPRIHYKAGVRFRLGCLRLRVLSADPETRSIDVVQDGWLWIVLASWHWSLRIFDLAYRRLIITAAVWNLAEYHQYLVPSWRDLHIVRWFKQQVKRMGV